MVKGFTSKVMPTLAVLNVWIPLQVVKELLPHFADCSRFAKSTDVS